MCTTISSKMVLVVLVVGPTLLYSLYLYFCGKTYLWTCGTGTGCAFSTSSTGSTHGATSCTGGTGGTGDTHGLVVLVIMWHLVLMHGSRS